MVYVMMVPWLLTDYHDEEIDGFSVAVVIFAGLQSSIYFSS
jgi:hypothetical protein